MNSQKKMNDNNMTITITEKINLQKVLYLYSLNEEELFKFCKKDKDTKYYNSTINTLADYIINGNDTNDKVYVKNNCNRYYCNNSLQLLQTDIRNFIYPDNTYDYDIKNCSASIMLYLSKVNNLDHKHIEYYINNRDNIIEKYKTTKEELKEMVNKLSNIDNPYKTNKVEIDDFISEFNFNKKILIDIYKNILPNKNYNEKTNPISSKYCEVFYYFESQIVQKVMNKYKDNVICYMFDGFNTNKKLDLHEINEITKDYGIEWINKPIETKFNYDKVITYDDIQNKLEKHIYKNFTLYDVSETYGLCEKYYKYISRTIKYCNDLWYILDSKTNLWKCVKEVQPYFLKILRIGLQNGKDIIKNELNCATQEENTDKIKELTEKLEKQNKNFCNIDKSSFCNQFKKNITEFITDNEFEKKLDNNPYMIAFKNGIYDIKTKKFNKTIQPSYYLTKTLDFDYDENINQDDLIFIQKEFLKIMNCNQEHYDYFMSLLGYSFCNDPCKYQEFYFCIGQLAGNGKSAIFESLKDCFKCYVGNIDSQLLDTDYSKKHKLIPSLQKYRLVYLNEMKEGKKIDSQIVKLLADGCEMDTEEMFAYTKDIKIKSKCFLLSNFMPDFDGLDEGSYRRYKHIQFDSSFRPEFKYDDYENKRFISDSYFKQKLYDKRSALLFIILDYAYKVYHNGLPKIPATFNDEKEIVKDTNMEIKEYLKNNIEITWNKEDKISKQEIIDKYKNDYPKNKKGLDQKTLMDNMRKLGYHKNYDKNAMKNNNRGCYRGYKLITYSNYNDPDNLDSDSD